MAVVSRLGCYSSILRGSQTRSCCLPQPHPSRTPFTSVPVNVGKNRKLSSYEVPHSCFHSEPTPESIFHTSLVFACQKFLVSCWAWPCCFLAQDSHLLLSTSACLSLTLLGALNSGTRLLVLRVKHPILSGVSILQLTLHVLLFVYCLLSLIKR